MSQTAALTHVTAYARSRRDDAHALQTHICRMSDVPHDDLREVQRIIKGKARVALHFHPDRPCASGETVAHGLLRDGRYRSQFETRISNGSLTAHAGGQRDLWENRLFAGAYHLPGVADTERPKFGSLELLRHAEGPSPRFGSCYLVLSADVSQRCTFTHLDSHEEPVDRGTLEEFDPVLAALLRDVFLWDSALGERDLNVPSFIERLKSDIQLPVAAPAISFPVRNLNYYIEAQVHGDIDVGADADALVMDPSFQVTNYAA